MFFVVTPPGALVATALTCEELWEELPQALMVAELALLFDFTDALPSSPGLLLRITPTSCIHSVLVEGTFRTALSNRNTV